MRVVREWIVPPTPSVAPLDPRARRAVWVELLVVLTVTFALSGASSVLSLLEAALAPVPLDEQTVALNTSQSSQQFIDLARQLLGVVRLLAWGALALYLLWRSGDTPRRIGLAAVRVRRDVLPGLGLAALIGLPGLAFYLGSRALGLNLTVAASTLDDTWWRIPVLALWSIANSFAEEVVVVAFVLTRLRRLGWSENASLLASALLRGSYHLYQGLGGGVGNVLMGLVFGRYWQRTGKLWPLVIAHAVIDLVAFVGYQALRGRVGWLP